MRPADELVPPPYLSWTVTHDPAQHLESRLRARPIFRSFARRHSLFDHYDDSERFAVALWYRADDH